MGKKGTAANADVTRYKNYLRSKVELLELQCKELDLTMSLHALQTKHQEMFPEAYREPIQPETITKEVIEPWDVKQSDNDGIAEG